MISSSSVNSSVEMPSKHFFRWGCTRLGSLVSERISSISSLDRKKKRGKATRLTSRYDASPFWMVSSSWLASSSRARRSLSRAMVMHSGFWLVLRITSRQMASTVLNMAPSSGSCCTMSSEPKMGSRYCHVF